VELERRDAVKRRKAKKSEGPAMRGFFHALFAIEAEFDKSFC
jgi:hypothetical protein